MSSHGKLSSGVKFAAARAFFPEPWKHKLSLMYADGDGTCTMQWVWTEDLSKIFGEGPVVRE
jgi:hypothetical protein